MSPLLKPTWPFPSCHQRRTAFLTLWASWAVNQVDMCVAVTVVWTLYICEFVSDLILRELTHKALQITFPQSIWISKVALQILNDKSDWKFRWKWKSTMCKIWNFTVVPSFGRIKKRHCGRQKCRLILNGMEPGLSPKYIYIYSIRGSNKLILTVTIFNWNHIAKVFISSNKKSIQL